MSINPVPTWADSYEKIFKDIMDKYKGAQTFDPVEGEMTAGKGWQKWVNDNGKTIQCIAPLAAPITLSGSASAEAFSPLLFSTAKTPPQMAQILATAWQTWALGITWSIIPPAPPFSIINSILTSPIAAAASFSALLSGLTAELAITPTAETVKLKYQNLATLFFTATVGLQVQFIGMTMSAPPVPLMIPVPVF